MNSALASTGRTKPSSITPSVEKRSDELEYAFVDNPFRDARHQNVVIDSVEKFFEVEVDHDVVAFGDIPLRLGPPPDGRIVPHGSRSYARRTSDPNAFAEPAVEPAGSVCRRHTGRRVS
jgi:hypothetical protein